MSAPSPSASAPAPSPACASAWPRRAPWRRRTAASAWRASPRRPRWRSRWRARLRPPPIARSCRSSTASAVRSSRPSTPPTWPAAECASSSRSRSCRRTSWPRGWRAWATSSWAATAPSLYRDLLPATARVADGVPAPTAAMVGRAVAREAPGLVFGADAVLPLYGRAPDAARWTGCPRRSPSGFSRRRRDDARSRARRTRRRAPRAAHAVHRSRGRGRHRAPHVHAALVAGHLQRPAGPRDGHRPRLRGRRAASSATSSPTCSWTSGTS